jgi:hypothetical protein
LTHIDFVLEFVIWSPEGFFLAGSLSVWTYALVLVLKHHNQKIVICSINSVLHVSDEEIGT